MSCVKNKGTQWVSLILIHNDRMSGVIEGFNKASVEPFQAAPAAAPTAAKAAASLLEKIDLSGNFTRVSSSAPALSAANTLAQERFRRETTAVSEEKNKFADAQLQLYAFLNIVGVGLIIYIAGATR